MTDLMAFLKARLDADQAEADRIHDIFCDIHRGFAGERGDCDCGEPARVLAEVAALRRIVELHDTIPEEEYCAWCDERKPCQTLRLLATIWADHPDYREEWRP
jgi:hypothetical protein